MSDTPTLQAKLQEEQAKLLSQLADSTFNGMTGFASTAAAHAPANPRARIALLCELLAEPIPPEPTIQEVLAHIEATSTRGPLPA